MDSAINNLVLDINTATQKATKTFSTPIPHSDLLRDLINLIKIKNKILSRLQQYPSTQLKIIRNAIQRAIRSRVLDVRNKGFVNFLSEAESHPSSVWKVTSALRNRQPILPPKVVNGVSYSLDSGRAEILADSLQSQCSPNLSSPTFMGEHTQISRQVHQFSPINSDFVPPSPKEIDRIIRSL